MSRRDKLVEVSALPRRARGSCKRRPSSQLFTYPEIPLLPHAFVTELLQPSFTRYRITLQGMQKSATGWQQCFCIAYTYPLLRRSIGIEASTLCKCRQCHRSFSMTVSGNIMQPQRGPAHQCYTPHANVTTRFQKCSVGRGPSRDLRDSIASIPRGGTR